MAFKFLRNRKTEIDKSLKENILESKLGSYDIHNNEIPYCYGDYFEIEETSGGKRLKISSKKNQVDLIYNLSDCLNPPYFILYVLIVTRLGTKLGRYQSPPIETKNELKMFLDRYKYYFETDARHHIWISAIDKSGTLVYDQHNVIFAYGSLERYIEILKRNNFKQKSFKFPEPHVHDFNPKNDKYEDLIIKHWDWDYFELQEIDKY